jgi:hypothetical protein
VAAESAATLPRRATPAQSTPKNVPTAAPAKTPLKSGPACENAATIAAEASRAAGSRTSVSRHLGMCHTVAVA